MSYANFLAGLDEAMTGKPRPTPADRAAALKFQRGIRTEVLGQPEEPDQVDYDSFVEAVTGRRPTRTFQQAYSAFLRSPAGQSSPKSATYRRGLQRLLEAYPTARPATTRVTWSGGTTRIHNFREVVQLA